jgi:DNA-binding beta-propeller fold protein YncE
MRTRSRPVAIVLLGIISIVVGVARWPAGAALAGVVYFDLAIDDARQLMYGSDQNGGTVHVIAMDTLDVVDTVDVGTQPAGLDISADGNELAVALYGQGEIAFVDLDTLSVTDRVVPEGTFGPNTPYDVLYGRPGRLYSVGNPGSGGFDYVHAFDTDLKTEVGRSTEIMRAAPRLAMTADHNTLYVSQVTFSPQKIYRFDITTDIPIQTAQAPHGPVQVDTLCVLPDGYVYTSRGQVWSADLSTQLGTFPASGTEIECLDSLQRLYVSTGSEIVAIDATNYSKLYGLSLAPSIGVARSNDAETALYVSTDQGIRVLGTDFVPRAYLPLASRNFCADFYDDFSNPASGWPVGEDDYVRYEYLGGEYRVLTKQSGYLYLFGAPTCDRLSYVVELDARWSGTPGNSYGIIFGVTSGYDRYYLFDVNTDYQQFRLYRRDPAGFVPIVPPTDSSAIHGGTAANHLKATRDGNSITLEVNGTVLGTWSDGAITGLTGVGLASSPYLDLPASDARFDNFRVTGLPGSGLIARSGDAPRLSGLELDPISIDWHR